MHTLALFEGTCFDIGLEREKIVLKLLPQRSFGAPGFDQFKIVNEFEVMAIVSTGRLSRPSSK